MGNTSSLNRLIVVLCVLATAAIPGWAAPVTLSGTVTNAGTGQPIPGIELGATRFSSVPAGPPDGLIPVEATTTTNALGQYSYTVDDSLPGLDRVLVFTRGYDWINELYPDTATAGRTPTLGEAGGAGVLEVDLTQDASGIDFAIQPDVTGKTTYMVEMNDGTRLATDVYLPNGSGPWPVVLYRTTYDKNNDNADAWPDWNDRGYAVVTQDIRGTVASEDIFRLFRDDGWGDNQDGYDTVEWVLAQAWCNGKIGTIGGSARGISQNQLAASLPPGVECQHIVVAASDLYHQAFFQGGAFRKELAEMWADGRGPESREYLDTVVKAHPHSNDPYWDRTSSEERYPLVTWPTVNIGGWYDIFLQGTINNFKLLQHNGQPGSHGKHKLIIQPYGHGTPQSTFSWPSGCTSSGLHAQSEWQWLDHWVKGVDQGVEDEPAVAYYMLGDVTQPGGPGNQWHYADDWPVPATEVAFYLHEGGVLDTAPPAGAEAADTYVYDPTHPVPTLGGANLNISHGPWDQAALEARSDVLVFTTPVLDRHVEITGEVTVLLYASSSALDTDFTAKLCDVYPDGRSMLVCDGIVRARHRNTTETDELLTPGSVYEFTVDLWETCIAFNVGHRIRVDISSSNYPRFDANPNTGEPFNQATHTVAATNTVYHDDSRPSRLVLRATGPDADANGLPDPADLDGDALPDSFEWRIIRDNAGDGIETLTDVQGTDDYDGDGSSNAEEYAQDTDPVVGTGDLPLAGLVAMVALGVALAGVGMQRAGKTGQGG